jgi:AcrR family transcriptional regulator
MTKEEGVRARAARRSREDMRAETRAALVREARATFGEVGFAQASMDAICERAGVTRGALYHHFGGKDGLLAAVVEAIDEDLTRELSALFDAHADPFEGLRAALGGYLSKALEPEVRQVLLKDAPAVLGLRLVGMERAGAVRQIAAGLAQLMDSGLIVRRDPTALAILLNGALGDAGLWVAEADAPERALALAKDALDALLVGLRPRP